MLVMIALLVALSLALAAFVNGAKPAGQVYAQGEEQAPKRTISVSGKGELLITPDVAYVNASVETRAATAKAAQADNAKLFAAVEKVLYSTYKLSEKDVKSSGFTVQPEYRYTEKEGSVITGYVATHTLRITYRKLADIGAFLDALSAAGVNRVNGIEFGTEKQDQYELEAIEKAMANAEAKAKTIAKAAKRQLQGVVSVTQNSYNQPYYGGYYGRPASDMAGAESAPTSVQIGEIAVRVDVSVVYEM